MLEELASLFSPENTDQTIALAIVLGGSFLLGIIVYFLLFHLPKAHKLKKNLKQLKDHHDSLANEHKSLSEKYTVQSKKLSRLEEDYATAQAEIKDREKQISQHKDHASTLEQYLSTAKTLVEDSRKEYKRLSELHDAQEKDIVGLKTRTKTAIDKETEAVEKMESFKRLMEELEMEKVRAERDLKDQERLHEQTKEGLRKAEKLINARNAEMKASEERMQELQTLNIDGENAKAHLKDYQEHIAKLKGNLQRAEEQIGELRANLKVYTDKETSEQETQQAEEQFLEDMLAQSAKTMEQEGSLYADFDEESMIEDQALLRRSLSEPTPASTRKTEPLLQLDDEEEDMMENTLSIVDEAMGMQGFFQDVDPQILQNNVDLDQPVSRGLDVDESDDFEEDDIDEDALIERTLAETEGIMDDEGYFVTAQFRDVDMIEDPELLEQELQKPVEQAEVKARGMGNPDFIEISEEDEKEMLKMLELAGTSMQSEGLYEDINPSRLIESDTQVIEKRVAESTINTQYSTAIEQAVVNELGRTVPLATEAQKNDLKRIDGIGLFIERKLNHLGIYTYEQVSRFDEDFIMKLAAAIGFSEKNIHNDKWVEQAKGLL